MNAEEKNGSNIVEAISLDYIISGGDTKIVLMTVISFLSFGNPGRFPKK
ncbi:hypothetical protein I33_0202 [Bacillus subtilis subsp. subtilis str. RO-NN-1]|nr:hypothetical protein I33_0202 [Bacillus subtilis subsp. subtilis str. RO-NN-1]